MVVTAAPREGDCNQQHSNFARKSGAPGSHDASDPRTAAETAQPFDLTG